MPKKLTNPLILRPGGKYRKARQLVAALAPHSTYVEPFAGGAAVFWNKDPADQEVLADLETWIIFFYDQVRKGGLQKCELIPRTRENFDQLKKCRSTCCTLQRNRMSYRGGMSKVQDVGLRPTANAKNILANLDQYEDRLKKTHLRIADFEDTMDRYDSAETMFYLDPPYTALERTQKFSKDRYSNGGDLPVEKVAQVAGRMQGKVMISYDDSPRARKAFQAAGLHLYKLPYTRDAAKEQTNELVATNYLLPKTLKKR